MLSLSTLAIIVLVLAVSALLAAFIGAVAGLVARKAGATHATALLLGGTAFGGTFSIILGVLTLLTNWLR